MSACGVTYVSVPELPRLAIVSRLFPLPYRPHVGGFNHRQFVGLAQRYRISVLVPVPFHEWMMHRQKLIPTRSHGMEIRYAGWIFPPKIGRTIYPACLALSLLPELARLRRFEPGCLLVSWAYPDAVAVAALNRALARPLIIKAHGSDVNVNCLKPGHAAQLRWASRQAAALVCVSEALAQSAQRLGVPRDKTVVVRNGVDTDLFAFMPRDAARAITAQPQDRRTVLFVGNVLRTKGIHELFDAFAHLAGACRDLDLVVIGDGPEKSRLDVQARKAGLGDRVRLTGYLPHDELRAWFNAADVVCLPSHGEGLPNVLMEAMACGVPCVATRVGGIPEVVTASSGELVEPHDRAGLAAALRRVLDRAWDRDAMMREARRFSWEANVDAMAALIDRTVAQSRQLGTRAVPKKPEEAP